MVRTGPGGVFKQTFPLYEIEVKKAFNYEKFSDKAASTLGMKPEVPILLQPMLGSVIVNERLLIKGIQKPRTLANYHLKSKNELIA